MCYVIISSIHDSAAMCLLSNDIHDYHYVSQGKVTVPSIDDKEDMMFCHVSFFAIFFKPLILNLNVFLFNWIIFIIHLHALLSYEVRYNKL